VDRLQALLPGVESQRRRSVPKELEPVIPNWTRTSELLETSHNSEMKPEVEERFPDKTTTVLANREEQKRKDGQGEDSDSVKASSEGDESDWSVQGRKTRLLQSQGTENVQQRIFAPESGTTTMSKDPKGGEINSAQWEAFRLSPSILNNAIADRLLNPYRQLRRLAYRILERNMMSPTSLRLALLDFLSGLALCSDMTVIPYILAWDTQASFYNIALMTTVVWWTLNIFFSFITGFYNHGELEMRPNVVALHYLRHHFLMDLVIALCDWAGFIATRMDGSTYFRALTKFPRFLKLLRLLRVSSFLRMSKLSSRIQNHVQSITFGHGSAFSEAVDFVVSTVALIGSIVWANHLSGCAFYAIGTLADSDTGVHWLDAHVDAKTSMTYWEAPVRLQYLACLQWSFAQMSPGAPLLKPANSWEVLFNLCVLICGVVVFGSVVSTITATMMHMRKTRSERRRILGELNNFLAQRRISQDIAMQAREQAHVKMLKKKQRIFLQDVSAMSLLSHTVLSQVHEETCRVHLLGHPLFRTVWHMHDRIMRKICIKSTSLQVLMPHDELFHENRPSEAAYQVAGGMLCYSQDTDTSMSINTRRTEKTQSVVEKTWLCWCSLWCHAIHVGSCKAVECAEVLKVDADGLTQAVRFHGPIRAFLHDYAASYLQQVLEAGAPHDLEIPFTEHREIVWRMGHQHKQTISKLALEALVASQWRLRLQSKAWATLHSEIRQGSSILVESCEGAEIVERVVAVTALRLTRDDGRVLGCLLRFAKDEGIFPFAQYLGSKQQVIDYRLEEPREAAERLVQQSLGQLRCARPLLLSEPRREDIVERSGRFGLRTHYLRTVFDIEVELSEELPGLTVVGGRRVHDWRQRHAKSVLPRLEECFLLEGSGFLQVCAWVADNGYLASLRTKTGVQALSRFAELLNFAVDPETGRKLFETQRVRFSNFIEP